MTKAIQYPALVVNKRLRSIDVLGRFNLRIANCGLRIISVNFENTSRETNDSAINISDRKHYARTESVINRCWMLDVGCWMLSFDNDSGVNNLFFRKTEVAQISAQSIPGIRSKAKSEPNYCFRFQPSPLQILKCSLTDV